MEGTKQRLIKFAEGIYYANDELWMPGRVYFSIRMTVVVLSDGALLLHSPIPIDDVLAGELAALGEVRYIVAPNCLHHLYVGEAAKRYTGAAVYGARGLADKRSDLTFEVNLGDALPAPLCHDFEALEIEGVPRLNEVVLFHRATKTLIVTDLVFNMHHWKGFMTTIVYTMGGVKRRLAQSRLWRMVTKDRAAAGRSVSRMLDWPIEGVIMAHGEPIADGAHPRLREALFWMLEGVEKKSLPEASTSVA